MLRRIIISVLLVLLLVTPTVFAESGTVTVLHTNETQGIIEANKQNNELGFMKFATLVSKLKDENDAIMLFDGGNSLAGGELAEDFKGESAIKAMNTVGYDALAAGGGEISYGYYQLLRLNQLSNFPILSANIRKDGNLILSPYTIIEKAGTKFAILGITSPDIQYKEMIEGLKVLDPVKVAKEYLPKLRTKADVTIALTNLDSDELIKQLSGFDLVINQQDELKRLKAVEKLELTVEESKVKNLTSALIDSESLMEGKSALANNPKLKFLSNYYNNAEYHRSSFNKEELNKVVDKLNQTMLPSQIKEGQAQETVSVVKQKKEDKPKEKQESKKEQISKQEKKTKEPKLTESKERVKKKIENINAKKLIADSIADMIGVNLVLVNSEKVECSKQEGKAVIKLPEQEEIIVKEISGVKLRKALEKTVASYPNASDEFLQLAGIEIKFDANKSSENRIIYAKVNGEELHDDAEYKIAVNSSVLSEDSRYLSLLKDEPTVERYNISLKEALEKYIAINRKNNTQPQVTGSIKQITIKEETTHKYIVKKGDTLSEIANKFKVTIDELLEFNQMSNPDLIIVGQTIYIP